MIELKDKNTGTQIQGLVVVNMLRNKLTKKIKPELEALNKAIKKNDPAGSKYMDRICGLTAVANALDIVTDNEYQAFTENVMRCCEGLPLHSIEFGNLTEHYCKDYGFTETSVVFKINIQERVNENFARYRQPAIAAIAYSKQDVLEANTLFIEFGKEFALLTEKDYQKAMALLDAYKKGDTSTEKLLLVPESFYTTLEDVNES